jgi:hypothetical protein
VTFTPLALNIWSPYWCVGTHPPPHLAAPSPHPPPPHPPTSYKLPLRVKYYSDCAETQCLLFLLPR